MTGFYTPPLSQVKVGVRSKYQLRVIILRWAALPLQFGGCKLPRPSAVGIARLRIDSPLIV